MDDNKETMILTKAITWVCVTIIAIVGGCCMHVDYRISKAIEQGADPVLARAAFSNGNGSYERIVHIAKTANK